MSGNAADPLRELIDHEDARRQAFPVAAERIFMAHAGVTALPRCAVDALAHFAAAGSADMQEADWVWRAVADARAACARLIGAEAGEIALLGPTSLGLSLVANGLPWRAGDEVICYAGDYPANVYPWMALQAQGVKVKPLTPERQGFLTAELVLDAVGPDTRLVALASCNYLSGYRVDLPTIGAALHERDVLLCVDGIQTLGAFDTPVEHVDFLSADAHKWMLGPCGAGVFYVSAQMHERLRPTLLGSWNVVSPEFVAQPEIRFYKGARRYEPGTLNMPGILAMGAALDLLNGLPCHEIEARLLMLRAELISALVPLGFRTYPGDAETDALPTAARSAIVSFTAGRDLRPVQKALLESGVTASLRQDREGTAALRFSPHFYNTVEEIARIRETLARV